MRLLDNPILPQGDDAAQLSFRLQQLFRQTNQQVNLVSEGRLIGITNAMTAAPTTGTWALGDFVRNSAPAEAGTAGSKYVIFGWVCVTAGTPGTWVSTRFLTGN